MIVDGSAHGSGLDGGIRLVIVESPDLAAPLVGALDAADVGAWVWAESEHALYFSPRVLHLLGLALEGDRPLLSRFLDSIHADDRPEVRRLLQDQYPAGPFLLRYRVTASDGAYRWIENRGRVERDAAGRLLRQGGAMRDVTAEVEQEQARREATARLEALINAIPFAVWGRSGADLRVTHQNATSEQWWGNLIGRGVAEMPPDVARVWRAQIDDALQGRVVRMRNSYRRAQGNQVLDEFVAPVTVGGEATGVVGVSIDVTEEQRRREFESLLASLASDFVSLPSEALDTPLIDALERIGRFLGVSVAVLLDLTTDAFRVVHEWVDPQGGRERPPTAVVDVSRASGLVARMRENRPLLVSRTDELPGGLVDKDWLAALRLQSFALVPARRDEGQLICLGLAAGKDEIVEWPPETIPLLRLAAALLGGVIARRRAEADRRLIDRRMQDAQKLESLGVLAGGIAHDFNNLLTAILGNASLIRSDLQAGNNLQEPLEQIEAASARAAELCRHMLAYAGRGRFALQLADLNDVVRQCNELLRLSVPKRAALEIDLADDLPPVLIDHAQIRQVLMNLVTNAAEALGDKEGTITIATSHRTVTARALKHAVFGQNLGAGRYVSLLVRDTGPGMSQDMLQRVFDPFFTTKFTGRGLGLAAVAGIVRKHMGAMRVESSLGEGASFELLLPAESAAGKMSDDGMNVPDEQSLARWKTTGTALVVDDEAGVRELIRTVLQRMGLTVVLAEDGRAGVEVLRAMADQVRVALIDLTMPGLDGREALGAMREIKPGLAAILMSGYTAADVGEAASHRFLQKPFTSTSVRRAVWLALDGK
jgi:signal transduction histidine kinase/PAS domain-containing protein